VSDWLLVDGARRLLADTCTHEALQAAESDGWSAAIWDALAANGYADLAALDLADALAVLTVAGEHAAPVPLAESVLAGWLLGGSVEGPVSVVAPGNLDELSLHDGLLSGTARGVPWGRTVERVVVVIDRQAVLVPTTLATGVARGRNLAGEPRDTLVFDGARVEEVRQAGCDLDERGALTRAALMAGALGAMARLTIGYAGERRQFGRPIAAFQAVQQHLVSLAQDASLVALAAEHAARADGFFEIAAAKLLASRAALTATRAAHQVHGAIGMTQEYRLHQLSRRLWAWRSEYGDEQRWAGRLGAAVAAAGAENLYPAITGGSAVI
jgi:acyl-CoA dehydrogenase